MNCPYCNNEMTKGQIEGDGRMPFIWIEDDEKIGIIDRVFRYEKYEIAEKNPFWKTSLKGNKCKTCNKIIIDLNQS